MKATKVLALLICAAFIQAAEGASIYKSKVKNTTSVYEILIDGTIEPGDSDKFVRMFFEEPSGAIVRVRLNSRGGDVSESLQIAGVVKDLVLSTRVDAGATCASACFFIWVAGASRLASANPNSKYLGLIGLHRPYLVSPATDSSSIRSQAALQDGVIKFLNGNFVPSRLIDTLITRPSNDIYWLTSQDIQELGRHPPPVEELFINKCGYDRRHIDRVIALELANRNAEAAQLDAQIDKIAECTAELVYELRVQSFPRFEAKYAARFTPKDAAPNTGATDKQEADLVSRIHPNWLQLVKTPDFVAWHDRQPPEIKKLSNSPKAVDAIRMLDLFKAEAQPRQQKR
jgi:hypothetical protein